MIKDLTEGKPSRVLFGFTVPMFLSVVFQQLYNICDSIIAGRFAGEDALSAVGASYPITMIFMAIAIGCNIGSSVVISKIFGSKDFKRLKTAISTSLFASIIVSIALTLIGIIGANPMMRAIDTPRKYLRRRKSLSQNIHRRIYLSIYI